MSDSEKKLSPLEWEVMSGIWDLGGKPSVRDVANHLYPNGEKAYTTVQTVMNNLVQKGYLKREKIGLVNFYKPTKKRETIVDKATETFVERVFGGSFQALANYLVHSDALTKAEIKELRKILEQKAKEKNDD
ncbi:MAG: BlaI/MecI/CopY family transcriptional regulator [Chloroherpetonaceae bacterium]